MQASEHSAPARDSQVDQASAERCRMQPRKAEVGVEDAAKVTPVVPDPDQYTAASPVEATARPRDSRDRNSR